MAGWDKLDLKTLASRLRAEGVSKGVIWAILRERTNPEFEERRRSLAALVVTEPYWSKKYRRFDPKVMSGMNAIYKEQNDEIKALTGFDNFADDDDPLSLALTASQEVGIPHADYVRMQSIESDYAQMKNDIMGKINGPFLPDDSAKIQYLDKELKEDLKNALPPDEYLEYQLHNSNTASYLRNNLEAFNPSEEEFGAIFKAQSAFDDQYGSQFSPLSPEQQMARQAHQADLLASIESALGPDRFADYKIETDPNYMQTNNLVERLGLPSTATQQVTSVQADITKRADAIQKDSSLSADEKTSQLAALSDEANTKITAVLGDNGMTAYRQSNGWWMQRLSPGIK
jgi:hypothetical protein